VKDGQNDNAPYLHSEVDAVREPLRGNAAYALVNGSIDLRLRGSEGDTTVNFCDELVSKVAAL
jgi:hypothetical protein